MSPIDQHPRSPQDKTILSNPNNPIIIQQLRQTVLELQEQLQKERDNHARTLKKEREDAQELLQGLQLRLHISETRTRTYEDVWGGPVGDEYHQSDATG
jgi:hypothetical protein